MFGLNLKSVMRISEMTEAIFFCVIPHTRLNFSFIVSILLGVVGKIDTLSVFIEWLTMGVEIAV